MPVVKSADVNIQEKLSLVCSGVVSKISGHVMNDEGEYVVAVFSLKPVSTNVHKHGITLVGDLMFAGVPPKKYGRPEQGCVRGVRVHLCGKKTCGHGKDIPVHLGVWAYEDGEPLSEAARAALTPGECALMDALKMEVPTQPPPSEPASTPNKTKERGERPEVYPMYTPPVPAPGLSGAIVEWCAAAGVPELAEPLARNKVRIVEQLAAMTESTADAFFAGEGITDIGARCSFLLALKQLRESAEPSRAAGEMSGWSDVERGTELPLALLNSVETVLYEGRPDGFAKLPQRGWVRLRRVEGAGRAGQSAATLPTEGAHSHFGEPGPIEEMARNAQQLLSRMDGAEGRQEQPGPRAAPAVSMHAPAPPLAQPSA